MGFMGKKSKKTGHESQAGHLLVGSARNINDMQQDVSLPQVVQKLVAQALSL